MMKIIQDMYPEGLQHKELVLALKEFHSHSPFSNGFDWDFQQLWAVMTDEDCLAFCLKHPQYANRFKEVK